MIAGIVALCLAALVWASDRTPAPSLLPAEATPPAGPTPARRKAHDASQVPTSTQPRARPRSPSPGPLPRGGYVFDGGLLVADAKGRTVTVRVLRGCAADRRTPPLRVVAGRFRYDGPPIPPDADVRLHVAGRFAGRDHAQVTFSVAGETCRLPARTVTATLT